MAGLARHYGPGSCCHKPLEPLARVVSMFVDIYKVRHVPNALRLFLQGRSVVVCIGYWEYIYR